MKPRGNIQSWVDDRVCFGVRGIILCRSHVVERVQDAGGVFDTTRKKNGGEDGKMESINSSYSDVLVQLFSLANKHNTARSSSCKTASDLMNENP
jgi:hypothetical protein